MALRDEMPERVDLAAPFLGTLVQSNNAAVAINFGNDLLLRNPDDPVALWFTGIAMAPTVEWGNLGQARISTGRGHRHRAADSPDPRCPGNAPWPAPQLNRHGVPAASLEVGRMAPFLACLACSSSRDAPQLRRNAVRRPGKSRSRAALPDRPCALRDSCLTAWSRIAGPADGPVDGPVDEVHVYIEGDGYAWATTTDPSDDPTPINPLALRLAAVDDAPNVLYLARPCQFRPAGTRELVRNLLLDLATVRGNRGGVA